MDRFTDSTAAKVIRLIDAGETTAANVLIGLIHSLHHYAPDAMTSEMVNKIVNCASMAVERNMRRKAA